MVRKFKMTIEHDFEKKELRVDLGKDEWMIPQILGIITDVQQFIIREWYKKEKIFEDNKKGGKK